MTIEKIVERFDDLHEEVDKFNDYLTVYGYLYGNNIQMPMKESCELTTGIMETWDKIKKIVNED